MEYTQSVDTFLADSRITWSRIFRRTRSTLRFLQWVARSYSGPPPHIVKIAAVKRYAKRYAIRSFVETGTLRGDMIQGILREFSDITSIELDSTLAEQARYKFRHCRNVRVVQGDSTLMLPAIVQSLRVPTIFWLDAHYSGGVTARGTVDTPIQEEISCLLRHPLIATVILIDDARCFDGTNGYPRLDALATLVARIQPDLNFSVCNDIIRLIRPHRQANHVVGNSWGGLPT